MGFVCFKNLCMIIIFILLSTYYISAFRLIHTHAELPETETKKDTKEHVRRAYTLKDHDHREHKNQSVHVKLEVLETEITPEKKVKTTQPTLTPNTLKDKIKEGLKNKDVDEEEKPKIKIIQKDTQGKSKFVTLHEDSKEDIKKSSKTTKESEKPKEVKEFKEIKVKAPEVKKGKTKEESSKIVKELFTKKVETPTKPTTKIIQKDSAGKSKFVPVKEDISVEIKKPSKPKETTPITKLKIETPKPKPKEETPKPKPKPKEDTPKSKPKITETKGMSKEESSKIVKELFTKKEETPKPKTQIIQKSTEGKGKFVAITDKSKEEIKNVIKQNILPPKATKPKEKPQKEPPKAVKDPPASQKKTPISKDSKPPTQPPPAVPPKPQSPKPKVVEPVKHTHDPNSSLLYFNLPSFSPNFKILENEECKKQGHILLEQLRQRKIWALKMFDSTAKVPSGILKGNLNQFGDYDQCVGIFTKILNEDNVTDTKISGKYCLASIDIEADVKEMKLPVHLAQSRAMIRSKVQDPGHFIPRFTTIRWGMCIPSGCNAEDAEKILEDSIKLYNDSNIIGLTFDVSVDSDQCYVRKGIKNYWDYPINTIITVTITVAIIITVFIATIRDLRFTPDDAHVEIKEESTIEKVFMSFSLKRTTKSLLNNDSDPNDIKCIHGVRSICSILLYIAHRLIPIGHVPFFNKINLTEIANSPASIILRLSVIYTDSFLLLSGILTSYGMSKDIEEKGHIPWFSRIVARFIRLTPPFMFIILYYAYIMEYLGEGPLWNTVVTPNSQLCKEYWWRNLLYIQNFYPFQEMCATHSHQLALDMQLSLIAPILVWLLYRRPLMGVTITIFLHTLSVILRYYTTLNNRLSLVIYHGVSISQLYRTANFLYASSIHRATPYLAGVCLGVLLRQMKPNFYMPKILTIMGWLVAGYFAGWALYSPAHLSGRMYQYDATEAAQFSALCSLAWALALSWIIFACYADNEGFLNKIFSSRPMILLSRISYTLYLTQFIVFFYYVGTIKNPTEFQILTSLSINEVIIVLLISTLLTLIIDLPAQKIKTILLKSIVIQKNNKENDDPSEIVKNNIQKANKEESEDKKQVHFNEEVEEHVLEDDDSKRLISQLSTESQMSVEEDLEDFEEDTSQIVTQSVEDLEEDKNQRLVAQFFTDSQISAEEDLEDDASHKLISEISIDEPEDTNHKLVPQLSTESQISEDLEEDKLVSQLSTDEEHFDDREDVSQISMEEDIEELSIDEGHFEEHEDKSQISVGEEDKEDSSTEKQLSIEEEQEVVVVPESKSKQSEKQWFEESEEEEEKPEEEVVQKITVRLSANGKISVQEQIQQAVDDEDEK